MYERLRLWTCSRLVAHGVEVYGRSTDGTLTLDVRISTCAEHYTAAVNMARQAWPDQQHYAAAVPEQHRRIFTCGFAVAYAPGYLDQPPAALIRERDGRHAVLGLILGTADTDLGVVIPHTDTGEPLPPRDISDDVDGPVAAETQARLARAQHPLLGHDCPPAGAGEPPAPDTQAADDTPEITVDQRVEAACDRADERGAAGCLRCSQRPCVCSNVDQQIPDVDIEQAYNRFRTDTRYGTARCDTHLRARPCPECADTYILAWPIPQHAANADPFHPATWRTDGPDDDEQDRL